jgi:uncharacterized membrane protein
LRRTLDNSLRLQRSPFRFRSFTVAELCAPPCAAFRNIGRQHGLEKRGGRSIGLKRPTLENEPTLRSTAHIARHPIHPMLVPVPIVCFVGALVTDIAYAFTAEMMYADFSSWLLSLGFIFGVLAAVAGLIDFLGNRLIRQQVPAWPHLIGNAAALVLAFFNVLIHTRDAWTSVMPTGLILSIVTVLILPVTGWLGWEMVYRHGAGVVR